MIRWRLNVGILALVFVAALGLLWAGSHTGWWGTLACGVVFSFVGLTNYALIHEGAHDSLHPDPGANRWLGVAAGFLFPVPFSMLKVLHAVHHCCNRTDHEMFDMYYPGDRLWLKWGQWYGLLTGLFWPCIPVGMVLLAACPPLLKTAPFRRARTTAVLFDDFERNGVGRVRVEVLLIVAGWCALFFLLDLRWQQVLAMYACFAFNWSTRQYVTHAFTPRDVVNGALNLEVSGPMSWLLLKGNWDLVHHQQPWLPWTELEAAGRGSVPPVGYWRQYARMWRGPRLTRVPGPQRLSNAVMPGFP